MICERCGREFTEDWRGTRSQKASTPRFCSRQCANSRSFSEESKQKKSEAAKLYIEKAGTPQRTVSKETAKRAAEKRRHTFQEKYDALPWEKLAPKGEAVKRRILVEQNSVCSICGLNTWMEKPLILQLDHIDGNNENNQRSNLRMICPNCHSQTETFCRGHSRKKKNAKTGNLYKAQKSPL